MKIVHMITGVRHFTFQFPSNPWSPPGFFIKADETLVLERTECLLLWESSSLFLSISAWDWSAIATAIEIASSICSLDKFHFSSFFFCCFKFGIFFITLKPYTTISSLRISWMGLRSENYVYCSFVFSTSRGPMSPKSKNKAAFLKFIYSHKQKQPQAK